MQGEGQAQGDGSGLASRPGVELHEGEVAAGSARPPKRERQRAVSPMDDEPAHASRGKTKSSKGRRGALLKLSAGVLVTQRGRVRGPAKSRHDGEEAIVGGIDQESFTRTNKGTSGFADRELRATLSVAVPVALRRLEPRPGHQEPSDERRAHPVPRW